MVKKSKSFCGKDPATAHSHRRSSNPPVYVTHQPTCDAAVDPTVSKVLENSIVYVSQPAGEPLVSDSINKKIPTDPTHTEELFNESKEPITNQPTDRPAISPKLFQQFPKGRKVFLLRDGEWLHAHVRQIDTIAYMGDNSIQIPCYLVRQNDKKKTEEWVLADCLAVRESCNDDISLMTIGQDELMCAWCFCKCLGHLCTGCCHSLGDCDCDDCDDCDCDDCDCDD